MSDAAIGTPRLALRLVAKPSHVPIWVRRVASPAALLIVWELIVRSGVVSSEVLAPPSAIPATVVQLWRDGSLQQNIIVSSGRAAIGLALGTLVGVVVAGIAGLWRWGEDAADPLVQMLRPIPATALMPLVVLLMGLDETPKIFLVAYGVFFPVYLNTFQGIRSVDVRLVESAAVHGLNRWGLVRQVILPSALPSFFVGFRFSVGVSWIVLVVAEQLNAQSGVGYLMIDAQRYYRPDVIIVGLIVYAMFGFVSDTVVRLVERKTLKWRQEFQGA